MDAKSVGTRRAYAKVLETFGLTNLAEDRKFSSHTLRASTIAALCKAAGRDPFEGDMSVIVKECVAQERKDFANHMQQMTGRLAKKKRVAP